MRTFFGSSEKSGCTAVFGVLGMHVSVSFREVLESEHCSCSVCVCLVIMIDVEKVEEEEGNDSHGSAFYDYL